tara:strand:+ start:610 stop:924 length:315 start_codon:yes stop_codon:yes gene_type:complete
MKKIKLTETELTRLIEKVIKEQSLPRGIRKGSEEHADWIRSQQVAVPPDGSDEILEELLSIAQRLERFVKETRKDGNPMEDLRDIETDVKYQIIQYIATTEGRG